MRDSFGREIDYLRIAVTDRCQLRCRYCMEESGVEMVPHSWILRNEEFVEIARVAVALGIRRIRLTGGEPLLRRGLPELVARLAAIPGLEELTMTTNGLLLEELAAPLHEAGLQRINVSIDSLDAGRYRDITRGGDLRKVLAGLDRAAGLFPLRINSVLLKGVNDTELPLFLQLARQYQCDVRFIELMALGSEALCGPEYYISAQGLEQQLLEMGAMPPAEGAGHNAARYYRLPEENWRIGIISPLRIPFCDRCSRLRLTSNGMLMPCLHSRAGVDLAAALRSGQAIETLFEEAVRMKPSDHQCTPVERSIRQSMNTIGG